MTQRPDFRAHLKGKPQDMNKKNPAPQATDDSHWQAVTALILAILGIYFVWVPGLNFILGLLALFFGIRGLRSQEKVASITAIIVSAFNIFGSLLVIGTIAILLRFFGWNQVPTINDNDNRYHQSTTHQSSNKPLPSGSERSNNNRTSTNHQSSDDSIARSQDNTTVVNANHQELTPETIDDNLMVEFPPQFLLLDPEEWQSIVESQEYTIPLRTPEGWR